MARAPLLAPVSGLLPRRRKCQTVRVKSNLKPATAKARALLKKLEALAERGIGGEKTSAQNKLARLRSRFDFTGLAPSETPDLFQGRFQRAAQAKWVYSFTRSEFDVANSVKWAIESATKIPCVYRDGELLAEATPATARKLGDIAGHIALSFRTLLEQFSAIAGVSQGDRSAFVMGLYDGMMNEARKVGEPLPGRFRSAKKPKGKQRAVTSARDLHVHPYSVALNLGKQIRFSVPLEEIAAELEAVACRLLGEQPASRQTPSGAG